MLNQGGHNITHSGKQLSVSSVGCEVEKLTKFEFARFPVSTFISRKYEVLQRHIDICVNSANSRVIRVT